MRFFKLKTEIFNYLPLVPKINPKSINLSRSTVFLHPDRVIKYNSLIQTIQGIWHFLVIHGFYFENKL